MKYTKRMIIVLVLMIAAGFLTTMIKTLKQSQSILPILIPIGFEGEYSLGSDPWQELTQGSRIPADGRDLRLRGRLDVDCTLNDEVFFYLDHIDMTMKINGEEVINTFKPTERIAQDFCGNYWYQTALNNVSGEDYIEIMLHSAHSFGNRYAYRDFVDRIYSAPAFFVKNFILEMGNLYRMVALAGAVLAFVMLGFALAFSFIGIAFGGKLALFGLSALLMSGYIALDTPDVSFWSELIMINTSFTQICMMLAALGFGFLIADILKDKKKQAALISLSVLVVLDACIILLSGVRVVRICSTLLPWGIVQGIVSVVLLGCIVHSYFAAVPTIRERYILLVCGAMQVMILIDLIGGLFMWRYESICSKMGFVVVMIVFLAWVMYNAPKQYRQVMRINQLEGELEESRIAVMVSQIHPHFLFNALSTIRHLCRKQPELAWEALGDFSSYLRANTEALTNNKLIPFQQELRHIQSYLKLEQLRFGSRLNVVFDIEEEDFLLPPLTVQPLIENAVKHGIFYAKNGGTVCLTTRRQGGVVVIVVSDDGVGFDTEGKHEANDRIGIGLQNVQTRLGKLLHAQMTVESEKNKGTTVTIRIG